MFADLSNRGRALKRLEIRAEVDFDVLLIILCIIRKFVFNPRKYVIKM